MIKMTLNATLQDGKITIDINDLLKQIQQNKPTEVEYKVEPKPMAPATAFLQVEPKPMAFDTKEELDDYVKNNPNATCEGISTGKLVRFIDRNKSKYLFLKKANLNGAGLYYACLDGAYLDGVYFYGANLYGARLNGANLRGAYVNVRDLFGARYDDNTKFPEGFTIPETMIKI